ncbi:MAG: hypothetical protein M5R36_09155, partial [Deltaproteobacteria bacterium]|nr:hypothetical protein [Deltaproteobacteria bacterium]
MSAAVCMDMRQPRQTSAVRVEAVFSEIVLDVAEKHFCDGILNGDDLVDDTVVAEDAVRSLSAWRR